MTRALLISGGRIIDPGQKVDKVGSLLITEGKVSWLGDDTPPVADYDVLGAKDLVVCPGFVDLHCHLRQPGFEDKETIASGSQAAARGGFTTICCMPNTEPPLDSQSGIDYVKSIAAKEAVIRVLPIGCISKGRKGEELAEMGEMVEAGAVAFSDDGSPVASSRLMCQALEYSLAFGRPITDHCEDVELSKGGQINEGIIATRLGLQGIPTASEENIVARDLALAELTGAWLHVAHASTSGSVELIHRAKEKGIRVTAEATPHHLTLTEEEVIDFKTDAKVNPPLRTKADIGALIQGLKEDAIDVIATDHAPHTENDKLCEFAQAPFGISGFETALGSLMNLVHSGQLELNLLIAKLTCYPAQFIGDKLGTLEAGATADITIFDPNKEWVVDTSKFLSKGKNTPLAGRKLKGKVVATIYNGKLVYKDSND